MQNFKCLIMKAIKSGFKMPGVTRVTQETQKQS